MDNGGTMEQVLPPIAEGYQLIHRLMQNELGRGRNNGLANEHAIELIEKYSTALASLAQSEAERERLQGELAALRVNHPFGPLYDALCKSQAELARERELHQELRQVVKERMDACLPQDDTNWGLPCKLCTKSAILLAAKAAPASAAESFDPITN